MDVKFKKRQNEIYGVSSQDGGHSAVVVWKA